MPRFHLNVRTGPELSPDQDGVEFDNALAARRAAVELARKLPAIGAGNCKVHQVEVCDAAGLKVAIIPIDGR